VNTAHPVLVAVREDDDVTLCRPVAFAVVGRDPTAAAGDDVEEDHAFGGDDRALGPAAEVQAFALGESCSSRFSRTLTCRVEREGRLDGVLGTLDVQLCDGITLSTRPEAPATHWQQVVFPVVPPRAVAPGDVVCLELGFHAGGRWSYVLRPPV